MIKNIILCADDYGQSKEISRGIVALIRKGRLSATSCMTTAKQWSEHAQWLKPHLKTIDIGLHFNLTEGNALGVMKGFTQGMALPSLQRVLLCSQVHWLSSQVIKEELMRQLDRFHQVMGVLPDFIDGHQHIHQLPVIRDALLEVYCQHLRHSNVYIRSTWQMPTVVDAKIKGWVIRHTGARYLEKRLKTLDIPHNLSFSGVYNFSHVTHYPELCLHFLKTIGDGGLIMCHPAFESSAHQDPIYRSRYQEYQYFSSEQFDQHLAEAAVKLRSFWY